jgi:hypothetical protein
VKVGLKAFRFPMDINPLISITASVIAIYTIEGLAVTNYASHAFDGFYPGIVL